MNIIKKNFIFIFIFIFLSNCQGLGDFKKAMTGQKVHTTDEFLIKKKDPLILPPDMDELPTPNEQKVAVKKNTVIEKQSDLLIDESENIISSSIEKSLLRKIKTR